MRCERCGNEAIPSRWVCDTCGESESMPGKRRRNGATPRPYGHEEATASVPVDAVAYDVTPSRFQRRLRAAMTGGGR